MGYQIMHNEKARLAAENAALENQGEMQRRRAEHTTNMAERILSLEAENAALREQLAAAQKDAERYRVLRDSEYQLHEDDPSVSDSFFEQYFGEDLDKAVDDLKARFDAAIEKENEK